MDSLEEIRARKRALKAKIEQLAKYEQLTRSQQAEWNELTSEFDALDAREEQLVEATERAAAAAAVKGGGGLQYLKRPGDPWHEGGEVRDRARWAAERLPTSDEVRGRVVDVVENEPAEARGAGARWALVTSNPDYTSAFEKLLRDPQFGHTEFSDAERAAYIAARDEQRTMAVGTNTAGGFLVPTHLDPTIILTGDASQNVMRRLARREVLTAGNVWNGITSAGVTASWDAELAEVSDDSPTLSDCSIAVHKAAAFIAASFEAAQDTNIAEQLATIFADAKDRLEGAAFETGSGNGQPRGIWTALDANTNVELESTTAATIGVVDLNTMYYNVPVRWRARAKWLMNPLYALAIKDLGTAVSASFTANLSEPPTGYLHGKPVVVSDDSPATQTTTVRDNEIILGDFRNYVIVDRVGSTLEYIPNLMGTTNGRPIGARGWYLWFRTGGDSVVDDAFRLLQDKTSA